MSVLEILLSGLAISIVSGVIGSVLTSKGRVEESHCIERRNSCQRLLLEKIDNLSEKFDSFTKAFNKVN